MSFTFNTNEINTNNSIKYNDTLIYTENSNSTDTISFSTDILEGQDNVAVIEAEIESLPEGALIVFDLGNVLMEPVDALLHKKHKEWRKKWLEKHAPQINEKKWDELQHIIYAMTEWKVVNKELPFLVEKGKQKAKTIALSRYYVGLSSTGKTYEQILLESLKKEGIDFADPFPTMATWVPQELQATTYTQGLIATVGDPNGPGGQLKGPVLEAFLKQLDWNPTAVLFVDDRLDQCKSVCEAMTARNIPAHCIQYTEATGRAPKLDEAVANWQMIALIKENRWYSDKDVLEKLNLQ